MKDNTNEKGLKIIDDINSDKKAFTERLKLDTYLIELQKKLKQGKIEIKHLTDKEKDSIIELYQKQIDEKKIKLNNLNKKIL